MLIFFSESFSKIYGGPADRYLGQGQYMTINNGDNWQFIVKSNLVELIASWFISMLLRSSSSIFSFVCKSRLWDLSAAFTASLKPLEHSTVILSRGVSGGPSIGRLWRREVWASRTAVEKISVRNLKKSLKNFSFSYSKIFGENFSFSSSKIFEELFLIIFKDLVISK